MVLIVSRLQNTVNAVFNKVPAKELQHLGVELAVEAGAVKACWVSANERRRLGDFVRAGKKKGEMAGVSRAVELGTVGEIPCHGGHVFRPHSHATLFRTPQLHRGDN